MNLNAGPEPDTQREYINFHAFAANLYERRIFRTDPTWAIWMHRDVFESRNPLAHQHGCSRDIYVLVAAQWILWSGQSLFKQLIYPGEISSEMMRWWSPGELYDGKPDLSLHRWHFWRDGYNAVASSGNEGGTGYGQESKDVATKAAAIMDALEKNMSF